MRIVFMGTPDFAVPSFLALIAAGHEIACAYTQPPRPAGRGKKPQPGAVQRAAEAAGIPVRTPATFRDEAEQRAFAALAADVAVVAAYGLILPSPVLDAPLLGCINVHASLLPRWRGAAPVQRAILAGDALTGVAIMQMERGLDTGPVRAMRQTPVAGKDAGALTAELAEMGAQLLLEVLADPPAHPPVPQPCEGVTHAAKIDKAEARLDFGAPARAVERQVRAFAPSPGAFFELGGERYRVLAAELAGPAAGAAAGTVVDGALTIACGDGIAIRPVTIQRSGRPAMTAAEMLRGRAIPTGTILV